MHFWCARPAGWLHGRLNWKHPWSATPVQPAVPTLFLPVPLVPAAKLRSPHAHFFALLHCLPVQDVGSVYETCNLGVHIPASDEEVLDFPLPSDLGTGVQGAETEQHLTAAYMAGLRVACEQLQRQLLLDPPPELEQMRAASLDSSAEPAVLVYLACPLEAPADQLAALLEAACCLAPCTPLGAASDAGVGLGLLPPAGSSADLARSSLHASQLAPCEPQQPDRPAIATPAADKSRGPGSSPLPDEQAEEGERTAGAAEQQRLQRQAEQGEGRQRQYHGAAQVLHDQQHGDFTQLPVRQVQRPEGSHPVNLVLQASTQQPLVPLHPATQAPKHPATPGTSATAARGGTPAAVAPKCQLPVLGTAVTSPAHPLLPPRLQLLTPRALADLDGTAARCTAFALYSKTRHVPTDSRVEQMVATAQPAQAPPAALPFCSQPLMVLSSAAAVEAVTGGRQQQEQPEERQQRQQQQAGLEPPSLPAQPAVPLPSSLGAEQHEDGECMEAVEQQGAAQQVTEQQASCGQVEAGGRGGEAALQRRTLHCFYVLPPPGCPFLPLAMADSCGELLHAELLDISAAHMAGIGLGLAGSSTGGPHAAAPAMVMSSSTSLVCQLVLQRCLELLGLLRAASNPPGVLHSLAIAAAGMQQAELEAWRQLVGDDAPTAPGLDGGVKLAVLDLHALPPARRDQQLGVTFMKAFGVPSMPGAWVLEHTLFVVGSPTINSSVLLYPNCAGLLALIRHRAASWCWSGARMAGSSRKPAFCGCLSQTAPAACCHASMTWCARCRWHSFATVQPRLQNMCSSPQSGYTRGASSRLSQRRNAAQRTAYAAWQGSCMDWRGCMPPSRAPACTPWQAAANQQQQMHTYPCMRPSLASCMPC